MADPTAHAQAEPQAHLDRVSPMGSVLAAEESARLRLLLARAGRLPPPYDASALDAAARRWACIRRGMGSP